MSAEPEVLIERNDRILIVTINRPGSKNAVNAAVSQGLADAMDRLDGDPGLSVAILIRALVGPSVDLKAFTRGEDVATEGRGMGFTERRPVKPLIAAVEGYALGRRYRVGAGNRLDRRVEGFRVRNPRGEAWVGGGWWRSAPPAAADPVSDRDGVGADR